MKKLTMTHTGRFKPTAYPAAFHAEPWTFAIEPFGSCISVIMGQVRSIAKFLETLCYFVTTTCSMRRWHNMHETIVVLRLLDLEIMDLMEVLTGLRYFRAYRYGVAESEIKLGPAFYTQLSATFGTSKFPPTDTEGRARATGIRKRKLSGGTTRAANANALQHRQPRSVHTKPSQSKKPAINTVATISQLPPVLLCNITSLSQYKQKNQSRSKKSLPSTPSLRTLSNQFIIYNNTSLDQCI
jgi:hypothetical protein